MRAAIKILGMMILQRKITDYEGGQCTRGPRAHIHYIQNCTFQGLNISTWWIQYTRLHFYPPVLPLILLHGIEHCIIRSNSGCEEKCDVVMGAGLVRCVLTAAPWPGGWRRCRPNIHNLSGGRPPCQPSRAECTWKIFPASNTDTRLFQYDHRQSEYRAVVMLQYSGFGC